jgi:cytochrome c-type biogenesis protein
MSEYLEAFVLGNAAILGNVCVLPLYPGLIAFLAGRSDVRGVRSSAALGALVLAGVLSLMLVAGLLLFLLRRSVSTVLPALLPIVYAAVLVLGVLLLAGRNPFARLASAQVPVLRNPYATAYLYGLLLGPMTLPCTGPLIISAFVLGASSATALADGLLYFLAFGLGFGWPLVALAMVAAATGRRLTGWLARREPIIHRLSGVLLLGIALFGFWVDVLPNLPRSWFGTG